MKKLFFTLSLITNTFATDLIEKAILESNLDAFTTELENRKRTYAVPFTPNEQLKYLDLSKEVASRRRNYFEIPMASELYSEEKNESIVPGLELCGGVASLYALVFTIKTIELEKNSEKIPFYNKVALTLVISAISLITDGVRKLINEYTERKKSIETKYNNALKIRQILFDNLTIA